MALTLCKLIMFTHLQFLLDCKLREEEDLVYFIHSCIPGAEHISRCAVGNQ